MTLGLLSASAFPAPRARAQPQSSVSLTLLSQSAWNGPKSDLRIAVRASNATGSPLSSMFVSLSIGTREPSRSNYEFFLRTGATGGIIYANSYAEPGTIGPGGSRTFRLDLPLSGTSVAAFGQSGLYPIQISLLSAGQSVATLLTSMIYLASQPTTPLRLAWTWVLSEPQQLGPSGVFSAGPIERDIAPGGRLRALAGALADHPDVPADLAVSSVLLAELQRMAGGYQIERPGGIERVPKGTGGAADAAHLLAMLKTIAARPSTELVAFPFADPSIPSVVAASPAANLRELVAAGRTQASSLLGRAPTPTVAWAPDSQIDAASLSRLAGLGVSTLLVNSGWINPPPDLVFSPPAVAALKTAHGSLRAVVPDSQLASIAQPYTAQQGVQAAHAMLGDLAAIYFEFPATPDRGAAIVLPGAGAESGAFFYALASLVRASPWLRPSIASSLAATAARDDAFSLANRPVASFSIGYVDSLERVRASIHQFKATVVGAAGVTAGLDSDLLFAQGGTALSDPTFGLRFLDSADRTIDQTYSRILPPGPNRLVTLTSLKGSLPITIRNRSGFPVHARVRLIADRRLAFPDGASQVLTIPARDQTLLFSVQTQAAGRFPVEVQIETPGGHLISSGQIIVRSTAYNRVALFLTIGAALFLLAWWARRFVPGRHR